MIEMTKRIRLEVLVDAPLVPKLTKIAQDAGITGHTLIRTASGRGSAGEWDEDLVTGATAKFIFLAVANAERADRFLEATAPMLSSYSLVMLRSEVDVVRPERF